jgi:hypothetical protein
MGAAHRLRRPGLLVQANPAGECLVIRRVEEIIILALAEDPNGFARHCGDQRDEARSRGPRSNVSHPVCRQ